MFSGVLALVRKVNNWKSLIEVCAIMWREETNWQKATDICCSIRHHSQKMEAISLYIIEILSQNVEKLVTNVASFHSWKDQSYFKLIVKLYKFRQVHKFLKLLVLH